MANEQTNKALEQAATALNNINCTEPAAEGARMAIEGLIHTIESVDLNISDPDAVTGETLSVEAVA